MKHFGEDTKGAEQLLTGELENKLAHQVKKKKPNTPLVIEAKLRKQGTLRGAGNQVGGQSVCL